jgi:hypothetical protein
MRLIAGGQQNVVKTAFFGALEDATTVLEGRTQVDFAVA